MLYPKVCRHTYRHVMCQISSRPHHMNWLLARYNVTKERLWVIFASFCRCNFGHWVILRSEHLCFSVSQQLFDRNDILPYLVFVWWRRTEGWCNNTQWQACPRLPEAFATFRCMWTTRMIWLRWTASRIETRTKRIVKKWQHAQCCIRNTVEKYATWRYTRESWKE